MYDSNVFDVVAEAVSLDDLVDQVFFEEENESNQVKGDLKKRVAVVKLRHISTDKVMVFMSFHNIFKNKYMCRLLTETFYK